jgi:hypothetical protein
VEPNGLFNTIKNAELKKYWPQLSLDPARRKFIELLLYES